MTQKDKVKELVGRGLDSYHTKSLQQIDRIEKKNKEQNHKISILSNELDNDYLTKTEEGSVISLEHSKKGMVYLDELQGNTLVNYCTDGSKEMTLNGDIDVEGTFVTLTEGVDNGKVDVVCKGNTLVNAILENTQTVSLPHFISKDKLNIKPNTTYTILSSSSKLVADFEEFQPIQDGLLCWVDGKDLDTSTNIWKDRSLNNNNIILNNIRLNGDSSCSGIDNSSYAKLDITIPPSYTIETVFTYTDITKIGALWYMGDSSNSSHKYDYFWNYSDNGGSLSYRRKNASDTWITHDSLFFLKKDEVYRSVITYNGATKMARLYINGTFIKEVNMPNYEYYNTNTVLLMNNATASGERTLSNGKIFSFMMYDRVLTEDEISYNDSYKQAKLSNESRIIKNVVTTPNNIANVGLRLNGSDIVKDVILLEGDWTNKEVPSYFEGMKSVGELEDNKIEILSSNDVWHNKGFTRNCYIQGSNGNVIMENNQPQNCVTDFIQVKPNTTYTRNGLNSACYTHVFFDENKNRVDSINATDYSKPFTFTTPSNCKYLRFKFYLPTTENVDTIYLIEGTGTEKKSNKKEILLNEPLRGLPNGVRDRFVKIGGKLYIERRTNKVILNGTEQWVKGTFSPTNLFETNISDIKNYNGVGQIICDKHPSGLTNMEVWETHNGIVNLAARDVLCIRNSNTNEIQDLKNWLSTNPLCVIYETKTSSYEPLEIEPTLNTYNEVTHISNNSIIPCNMKIQNSGYNAIIKPSTLYTVALDTNKSGTIGMNLGGAKVTTTNNVATITTPATLSDDSLRLYGKGIKGSKVRILEGDKTNYIPSFFEGMKSSFEDKVQDDGSYKMEILMNNKNLFDANCFKDLSKWNVCMGSSSWKYYPIYIGKNKKAYIKRVYKDNLSDYPMVIVSKDKDSGMNIGGWIPIIHGNVTEKVYRGSILPDANGFIYLLTATTDYNKLVATIENCIISTVDVDYIEQKSNKIQFSSIEPLRGVGDVKDRFVFKDGKLMIERNCRQVLSNEFIYQRVHQPTYANRFAIQFSVKNCFKDHALENVLSCNVLPYVREGFDKDYDNISSHKSNDGVYISLDKKLWGYDGKNGASILQRFIEERQPILTVQSLEPTYEEIPFELQKIILEGYENGTLFFDTNIPPTSTVTYAGETPIVKSVKLNKTEVLNNTNDINDNIVPYLMDMDYRVVCLQLQSENTNNGISMARLFGGTYEMIKRDILSKRLTREEYGYRLADYFNAGKLTEEQVRELEDLR